NPIPDQTIVATSPNGAVAIFSATATDKEDGIDPVVFKERNTIVHSGDTFAIGSHTINASATDSAGNTVSESFNITVVTPPLFTSGSETVNFNDLQPEQEAAVIGGADLHSGLGGADIVALPNKTNYNKIVGNGQTLGWVENARFVAGDVAGQKYTITGGD